MLKKLLLLLLLGTIIGWIASCAWRSPLQVNIPVSWKDPYFQAEQLDTSK